MNDETIYLDFNATTPVAPEVADVMEPYLSEHFGNPSSRHGYGRRARRAVERAREQVAELIGCGAEEVVFTGSGTEANNLAVRGLVEALDGGRVVISAVEHPSVDVRVGIWSRRGSTSPGSVSTSTGRSIWSNWSGRSMNPSNSSR